VGNYLYRELSKKYNVTGISRDTINLLDAKAVSDYFNSHSFDVVINCAINPDSRLNAKPQVASDNLAMFCNLYASRHRFGRVIQFCSGAEFDCRYDIFNVKEDSITTCRPVDPYGMSKNATARISLETDNFYNLRLFGVFHPSELSKRLLPKILSKNPVVITDKYFDYLYLDDLLPVVEYFMNTCLPAYKDVNVVYPEKIMLSEFVDRFCKIQKLYDIKISVDINIGKHYTGDCSKLQELDLPTIGLDKGLARYIL
jgi:GDP-L-fucose synthase